MKFIILFAGLLCSPVFLNAQVAINEDGSEGHPETLLDLSSSSKGLLIPRMTTSQMNAIVNPPDFMMVVNTDDKEVCIYKSGNKSSGWSNVDSRGVIIGIGDPTDTVSSTSLYFNEVNQRFYVNNGTGWNMVVPVDDDWDLAGDDIFTVATGNVGIGTSSPQAKLQVEGSIRMVDGNQSAGYVMTSDADGTATWAPVLPGSGGYTMQWGGSLRNNSYAKYGGVSDSPGSAISDFSTKGVVLASGSITKFSWSSRRADNTSEIDIIINGTSHNYVLLTGDIGILTIPSIAVSEGDVIEIIGHTGTTPFQTGMTLYIN